MKLSYHYLLVLLLLLAACKGKDPLPEEEAGSLGLKIDNLVGSEELILNGLDYVSNPGDSFRVSLLNFYISNIELTRSDGTIYKVPQDSSYFLIKESDALTHRPVLNEVPFGEYTAISFVLGVDSLRNLAPIAERRGALDPGAQAEGMYWAWNSGYIFFKFEGTSPAAITPDNPEGEFMYHIGGFGGYTSPTINNLRRVSLDFSSSPAIVRAGQTRPSTVHIFTDLLEIFEGGTNLRIGENPVVMFEDFSRHIADNYAKMFRVDHVENY